MIPFSSSSRWASALPKAFIAALVTSASLLAGSTAFSQGYSTSFDANQGYTNGASLSGSAGWDTNDLDKTPTTAGYAGEFVGQSDYVGTVTGYSTPATDYYAYLGGGEHGTTTNFVLPGATTIYDYHAFTLGAPTSYAFNVDMSIASNTTYATRDQFGYTFLSSASGATIGSNLFSVNFVPDATTYATTTTGGVTRVTSLMNISYSVNGGALVATGKAISYDSIYHLTISVNVATKTANVSFAPTSGTAVTIATISLAAINPASVQEIAPTWILTGNTKDANGGYTSAGGNELLINNYGVTVPEPSTWAALGMGAGLCGLILRRRAVRA